jgi:hypothetical protein
MDEILRRNNEAHINHLLVVGLSTHGNLSQVFITVEGHATCFQQGIVSAVDRMLKLYFILNMEYPDESRHLLHFLQRIIDKLTFSHGDSDLALYFRKKVRKI